MLQTFDYLRTDFVIRQPKPVPSVPTPPTPEEFAERDARRRAKRNLQFERMRQAKAGAAARNRVVTQLMAVDPTCRLCAVTMNSDGLIRHRPRLAGEFGNPWLICGECHDRIKADREQRSKDTGGLLPMPIVADAENECEVSP